jgi:outer membrane receptor protein involved in Fe transport
MMMKKPLLTLLLLFVGLVTYSQVTLTGKTQTEKGEPVPSVIIALKKNGVLKANTLTDFDGLYRITSLDPGNYDVEFQLLGFKTEVQKNVKLTTGVINLNSTMVEDAQLLGTVVVKEYKVPIVKVDQTQQGGTLTSEQIAKLPTKDINSLVGTAAPGVAVSPDGGAINIKGQRSTGTDFYIDGIRVRGSNTVPANEVEQLEVITGGLEAKYGDVTGGIVSITTKGPSSKFVGGVEAESSQYLDAFGYNFINANVSGPILTRMRGDDKTGKYKESILGFRLSGQMRTNKDANPSAIPLYRVKEDVLKHLEEKPLTTIGAGTQVASAELLTAKDFDLLKIRPFENYKQYDFVAKIDAKLTKNVDVTFTGNYYRIEDQTTPGNWQVFNSQNNPTSYVDRYRTNVRLRHRLGNTEGGKSNSFIENAQYSIQGGYEKNYRNISDPNHKDKLFDYGYVGQFDYKYQPILGQVLDTAGGTPNIVLRHLGNRRELTSYKRSDINPVLANYNNGLDIDPAGNNINVFNGDFNRDNLGSVWNFHQNVGNIYDQNRKDDGTLLTAKADFSFDFNPNGSKAKAHNIQFGVVYEQRDDRFYSIAPFALWKLAELHQNDGINGTALDTTLVIGDTLIGGQKVKLYAPLANKDILSQTDIQFYKRYREKLGLKPLAQGNVANLTPEQMSLDMFTARELNDQGLIGYAGFDYLGNKLTKNVTFKDFFTARDANGVRTFPVAPINPIYVGGYIQDKFRIKDMIISLGIRVDRFDANTKVMKDPYSLYDIMPAKDFYENILKTKKPDNIGDDYKVYLTSNTLGKTNYNYKESDIRAYRQGEQWYTKTGQPRDPVLLFGEGTQTFAKYKTDTFATIKQVGFNPDNSFEDYKPQLNIMPRLAFSFPISTVANFFAHYDILVARPSSNNTVTALNYFYFDDNGRTPENNANLKPERTIDWEVGFQQKLNETSGIKMAAYYRDMRDMIQLRYFKYLPAPLKVNEYTSYDNIDFGTVKGYTFQYDLRATNHISGVINYTLQFADGTGSSAGSQRGLNRKGNIRVISPFSFDERHRITTTLDYRYDDPIYNGPKLFGMDILKNAGVNMQLITVSGRPYTKAKQPQPFGGSQIDGEINGARLPWTVNLDMRIDKTISLSKNPKVPLDVNVYLRVQNVLDARNIQGVYSATGSADNDGYLTSARGQSEVANTAASRPNDLEAYLHSYMMRMLDPGFYLFPRRIFLGATFSF